MRMNSKLFILIATTLFVVSIDQLTKLYIHTTYQVGESIPVIAGYFNITYVRNLGAAFGFLGQTDPTFRTLFFLGMPPIAMIIILLIFRGVSEEDVPQTLALSGVFAGAIGNYIDRLQFRYVIDFLDFHIKEKYTWPAFNIADSAIVLGMVFLAVLMLREGRDPGKKKDLSSSNVS